MSFEKDSGQVHWNPQGGYIKRHGPVCGIADKTSWWVAACSEETKSTVNCDHCLVWINEHAKADERVGSMQFNNGRSMSAADTEKAIADGVQKGVDQALAKIAKDFYESDAVGKKVRTAVRSEMLKALEGPAGQQSLTRAARVGQRTEQDTVALMKRSLREVLKESGVRQELVEVFKMADDEIEDEWDTSDEKAEYEAEKFEHMKQAVREVLQEQQGAGVGTQFVQNVYGPKSLTADEIYRAARGFAIHNAGDVTEDFPKSEPLTAETTHQIVKEALEEFTEQYGADHPHPTGEEERLNIHRAFRDMVELPGFQRRIKDMVKAAIAEDRDEEGRRRDKAAAEALRKWIDSYAFGTPRIITGGDSNLKTAYHGPQDSIIELPKRVVHYRKRYHSDVACSGKDPLDGATTKLSDVTCQACRNASGITF